MLTEFDESEPVREVTSATLMVVGLMPGALAALPADTEVGALPAGADVALAPVVVFDDDDFDELEHPAATTAMASAVAATAPPRIRKPRGVTSVLIFKVPPPMQLLTPIIDTCPDLCNARTTAFRCVLRGATIARFAQEIPAVCSIKDALPPAARRLSPWAAQPKAAGRSDVVVGVKLAG
jgi:hypothetical protein